MFFQSRCKWFHELGLTKEEYSIPNVFFCCSRANYSWSGQNLFAISLLEFVSKRRAKRQQMLNEECFRFGYLSLLETYWKHGKKCLWWYIFEHSQSERKMYHKRIFLFLYWMSLNFVSNRASTSTGFFCNLSLKLPIETNVKLLCWKLLVVLLFYGP